MARPRIKDVARHAGVSEKTVSNVINDYAHVSDRTRQVVREAIEHLGYRVNLAGRHLRKGRTGIIALVVPELDIPYFAELARHVIREAEERSLTVLIHQSGADRDHELAALAGFGSTFVDGIILSPLALTADDLRDRTGFPPTVLLGELLEEGADHVAIDNERAAREATRHLIGLGRRTVLAVGGATTRVWGLRRRAPGATVPPWRRRASPTIRPLCCRSAPSGCPTARGPWRGRSHRAPGPTRCCVSTTSWRWVRCAPCTSTGCRCPGTSP